MPLPDNTASSTALPSSLLAPDDAPRVDLRVDYELGGAAVGDASQGLRVQTWRAWTDGASIYAAPWPAGAPVTTLLAAEGVTELSLSFDQLMRPVLAYVQNGVTKLYWWDSLAGSQVVTVFEDAYSPMVFMDDKRAWAVNAGLSDVLFFYVRGSAVYYRQQRDRFGVERLLGTGVPAASRIENVGMGANNRVQVWLRTPLSATHTDLETDTLHLLDGTEVKPMGEGGPMAARWRSGRLITDNQPSMGWALVDASAYPVTLRVWGDGTLVTEQAVANDAPVRLRPTRAREWQVEISGTGRVVGVRLAEVRQELEGDDALLSV